MFRTIFSAPFLAAGFPVVRSAFVTPITHGKCHFRTSWCGTEIAALPFLTALSLRSRNFHPQKAESYDLPAIFGAKFGMITQRTSPQAKKRLFPQFPGGSWPTRSNPATSRTFPSATSRNRRESGSFRRKTHGPLIGLQNWEDESQFCNRWGCYRAMLEQRCQRRLWDEFVWQWSGVSHLRGKRQCVARCQRLVAKDR